MQGADGVTVCFFGDGAAARGDFHEALNLAALLKAPIVFVCENNLYFQTVGVDVGMTIENVADRAAGYGMPGVAVDGQDVLAVHEATSEAVRRARRGDGRASSSARPTASSPPLDSQGDEGTSTRSSGGSGETP